MKARSISLILFLPVRISRQNLNTTSASFFSLFSYLLLLFFLFVLFTRGWGGIAESGSRRRRIRIGVTFDHRAVIKWRQLASWNLKHKCTIESSFLFACVCFCRGSCGTAAPLAGIQEMGQTDRQTRKETTRGENRSMHRSIEATLYALTITVRHRSSST